MANNILGNPASLDSTGSVHAAGTKVKIKAITFVPGSSTASAELRDGNERTIAQFAAAASGPTQHLQLDGIVFDGLEVQAIGGTGTKLLVYTA